MKEPTKKASGGGRSDVLKSEQLGRRQQNESGRRTDRVRVTVTPRKPTTTTARGARLRRAHGAPLLEALPTENRASLGRPERNGGLLPALRAAGFGLCADGRGPSPNSFGALGFTSFAPLRLVLEALVGEKHLFAGSEHEFGSTFRAL